MSHAYVTVDVFTTVAFEGNPLAVFTDAAGLDDATMQRIANEMNLSETTFVFPPADPRHTARVRIFTPRSELPFAGHPTLGTACVLRGDSANDALVLEENVGPVPVRVAHALGLHAGDLLAAAPPEVAGAGPRFLFVAQRDREAVDRIEMLDFRALPDAPTGVFVFAATAPDAVYSRMFAPESGVAEDPATGSATGPLAADMIRHGLLPRANGARMVSEQGTKMGRRSFLHVLVHLDGGEPRIEVGGSVVPIGRGELTI